MNLLRISIELGEGYCDDDGTGIFDVKYRERTEIERLDILPELKNYKKEILRLVSNKLKEIELHANRNET